MQPITVTTSDASLATKYSRPVRMDTWANAQSVIQVTVTGTATYTIETTMDDPNSPTNPVAENSMAWVNAVDSAIVNKTGNATGTFVVTPIFIRIKQTAGNGSVSATIAQFSNAPF